jgi:hypothetical protein
MFRFSSKSLPVQLPWEIFTVFGGFLKFWRRTYSKINWRSFFSTKKFMAGADEFQECGRLLPGILCYCIFKMPTRLLAFCIYENSELVGSDTRNPKLTFFQQTSSQLFLLYQKLIAQLLKNRYSGPLFNLVGKTVQFFTICHVRALAPRMNTMDRSHGISWRPSGGRFRRLITNDSMG